MKKNRKTIMRCLLAVLCLVRIVMPSVIYADDPPVKTTPVSITEWSGGSVTETLGDVNVVNDPDDEYTTYGWAVHASTQGDESSIHLTTGDVSLSNDAKSSEGNLYYGVDADANNGSYTFVQTEDVTVQNINKNDAEVVGVNADAGFGSSNVSVITGDITVSGDAGKQTGLKVDSMSFDREALNDENLNVDELKGETSFASAMTDTITVLDGTGVEIDSTLKAVSSAVTDSIKAEDGIDISAKYGGSSSIEVNGDVVAEKTGIKISSDKNSFVDVFVDGTVSAATPLVISDSTTAENASVTLWKIEKTNYEDTQPVTRGTPAVSDNDTKIAEIVNYIIRIDQNSELLNPTKKDGSALDMSHGETVVKENTEIVLNVAEGWSIINAYNNGKPLEKDESGRYVLTVAYGGGIEFSAEFEQNIPVDGGADSVPSDDSSSGSSSSGTVVVRFVPPMTGIDDGHNGIVRICMYLLDLLIVALFCTSFITKANYNQFHNTLPDYLK